MADVLLPEARDVVGSLALLGNRLAHVPVGDQLHAVGVGVHGQDDHVVEDAQRLGVVARDHLVDELHQLVRAQHLGGVQAAVDPDHSFAFVRQRVRLLVGEAFGVREPARNLFVVRQLLVILGRGDDRHVLRAAFFGLADLHQLHAIGLGWPASSTRR